MIPVETSLPKKHTNWKLISIIIAGTAVIICLISILFLFPKNKNKSNSQLPLAPQTQSGYQISGGLEINGYLPNDSVIDIEAKPFNSTQFTVIVNNLRPADGHAWSWNEAKQNQAYVIRAMVKSSGTVIAQSDPIIAVAPASGEILKINSSSQPKDQKLSVISGYLDLNGYIPPGSNVVVQAKNLTDSQAALITTTVPAVDGQTLYWDKAVLGTSYEIKGVLTGSNGKTISQSMPFVVSAPAYNEALRINSTALSPSSGLVSISGKINFNGSVPANATISVAQRQSGQTNFNIFASNLPVVDQVTWSFNSAKPGVTYDLQAYLIVNGVTTTQSGIVAVAAPAANEALFLSTSALPPAPPSGSMSYNCLGYNTVNNVNMWQVMVSYNNNSVITNAQQFHLIIGTSNGGNQINDITANPKDPNHPEQGQSYTTGYTLTQGQTYYAQYSYSTGNGVFSNYSPAIQFSCSPGPTNTPAPQPTNTPQPQPTNTPIPQPTNTSVPTNTPVPPTATPTPKIAQCNQTCGSDGYVCADELVCIQTGGGLGGTTCRNPMCTDQADCTCP